MSAPKAIRPNMRDVNLGMADGLPIPDYSVRVPIYWGGSVPLKAGTIVYASAWNTTFNAWTVSLAQGTTTAFQNLLIVFGIDEDNTAIPATSCGWAVYAKEETAVKTDGDSAGDPIYLVGTAGRLFNAAITGSAFANQPTNDGIEVLSADAADTTQTLTLYGTTNGGTTVVVETVSLNGTTVVSATKTDWGELLGAELSAVCAGNVTIREASGNATITTITAGGTTAGVTNVAAGLQNAYNQPVRAIAAGATTKKVGVVGTDTAGVAVTDNCKALTGATAISLDDATMGTVTKLLTGDVENTVTVSFSVPKGTWTTTKPTGTDVPQGIGSVVTSHATAGVVNLRSFQPNASGEMGLDTLEDYARGSVVRGGSSDWEAYSAKTAGYILQGDGTDVKALQFDWDTFAAGASADMVHSHVSDTEGGKLKTIKRNAAGAVQFTAAKATKVTITGSPTTATTSTLTAVLTARNANFLKGVLKLANTNATKKIKGTVSLKTSGGTTALTTASKTSKTTTTFTFTGQVPTSASIILKASPTAGKVKTAKVTGLSQNDLTTLNQ